jgi:hypothetical protein
MPNQPSPTPSSNSVRFSHGSFWWIKGSSSKPSVNRELTANLAPPAAAKSLPEIKSLDYVYTLGSHDY